MSEEWEPFVLGSKAARSTTPRISIQANGKFGINAEAKRILGDFVMLFFNKKRQQIGFRGVTEEEKGAYPIRQQSKDANSYALAGKAFMAFYELDPKELKGAYTVEQQGDMLVIDLTEDKFRAFPSAQ
jgi:hypothetical protein